VAAQPPQASPEGVVTGARFRAWFPPVSLAGLRAVRLTRDINGDLSDLTAHLLGRARGPYTPVAASMSTHKLSAQLTQGRVGREAAERVQGVEIWMTIRGDEGTVKDAQGCDCE
jgi:hypothetical protein